MYRIAICDDDKSIAERLRTTILDINPSCQIQLYHDGEVLVNCKGSFDIIFLDIDMPGMDGIEAAKQIRTKDKTVKIIYLTSYAEYIHYAFAVHAFSYLLKPFTKAMIEKQLRDVREYRAETRKSTVLRFHTEGGIEEIAVEDIFYFEYVDRKVKMVTEHGDFIMRERIHLLSERMEPHGFLMPHKSFSVNLYHVKAIKGYDIIMMNGDWIPLSQKKSTQFRARLSSFHATQI